MKEILKNLEAGLHPAQWLLKSNPNYKQQTKYCFIPKTKEGEYAMCMIDCYEGDQVKRLDDTIYSLEFIEGNVILELKSIYTGQVNKYYLSLEDGDQNLTLKNVKSGKILEFSRQ